MAWTWKKIIFILILLFLFTKMIHAGNISGKATGQGMKDQSNSGDAVVNFTLRK